MSNKRHRKINNNINVEKDNEKDSLKPLTREECFNVLEMASKMYSGAYNSFFTPTSINTKLSQIGLSPQKINEQTLEASFKTPTENQETLIGYSEFLKFTNAVAKRTLSYLGNLPAFDYRFRCINVLDEKEYDSKEYLRDRTIVKNFLSRFDVRHEFSLAYKRSLSIDSFFCALRNDGNNFILQELPHKFCKITGKNPTWGFLFDFNYDYFLEDGVDINQYPSIMKDNYNSLLKNNENYYKPTNKDKRNSKYVTWCQTSPLPDKGNFACFKFNLDMASNVPFLSSMFRDAINEPIIRELQMNQYIIASQKILIGLIPLLTQQKSGQVKDALAVSPETAGAFLDLLKAGLTDAIKITGLPFSDIKQLEFSLPDKNMQNESNNIQSSNSGVTSRLIYSGNDRLSSMETSLSAEIDELITTSVYPQYARWLSAQINSYTKKYKFVFTFEGTKKQSDREFRINNAFKLADKGIVDFHKIASAYGEDIFALEDSVTESSHSIIWKKLHLLLNTNTKDDGSDNGGRPKVDIPSDSTDRSNDYIGE